jgi:hypothetical protein
MKNIYAVSAGSYSDYRVVALFSTPELAAKFMAAVPDSDYNEVEEYGLDQNTADLISRGYSVWSVHMLKDGTTERANRLEAGIYNVTSMGHMIWRRTQAAAYKGKGVQDCLTSTVWAKTEKQAVKIVNEHRAQMIANGQWS